VLQIRYGQQDKNTPLVRSAPGVPGGDRQRGSVCRLLINVSDGAKLASLNPDGVTGWPAFVRIAFRSKDDLTDEDKTVRGVCRIIRGLRVDPLQCACWTMAPLAHCGGPPRIQSRITFLASGSAASLLDIDRAKARQTAGLARAAGWGPLQIWGRW